MLTDERNKPNRALLGSDDHLGLFLDAIVQLQTIGKALHKRYEDNCNGDISETDIDEEGNDTVAAILQKKADDVAANVGLYTYHQTDPRGWPLRVSFYGPIPDNDYSKAVALDCRLEEDYDGPTTEEC
jgi:hypothetical protein